MAIKVKGVIKHRVWKHLCSSAANPNELIIAYVRDNKVLGYGHMTREMFDGEHTVFIQSTYVDPTTNGEHVADKMMKYVEEWAKQRNIPYMYMITKRNTKPFKRKYRFEETGVVMRRRI